MYKTVNSQTESVCNSAIGAFLIHLFYRTLFVLCSFLSDSLFDSISDFIITGPELCHKLVTVSAGPYQIIGYPMQLSHKKYHRNALLFNIAFVFPLHASPSHLRSYHPVIRKLANILEGLELECEFVHRRNERAKELQSVISRIFRSLNAYGECAVSVESIPTSINNESTTSGGVSANVPQLPDMDASMTTVENKIHLKLYPLLTLPPRVIPPWCVPIRVKDLDALWKMEWDLTLRQVIPFMDGVNPVTRISHLSGVHQALVAKCVRQLLYYEAVQLIDIFQFSNFYTPTQEFTRTLASSDGSGTANTADQLSNVIYHARRVCRMDETRPKPKFNLLVRIWSSLSSTHSIGEIFKNLHTLLPGMRPIATLETLNIHPRRFIQHALVNGWIRRVHGYPIVTTPFLSSVPPPPSLINGSTLSMNVLSSGLESGFTGLIHGRSASASASSNATTSHLVTTNASSLSDALPSGVKRSLSKASFRSRQSTDESDTNSVSSSGGSSLTQSSIPIAPMITFTAPSSITGGPSSAISFRSLERYLDGEHHYDQLCCIFQRSFQQIDEEIRRSKRCIVIYK